MTPLATPDPTTPPPPDAPPARSLRGRIWEATLIAATLAGAGAWLGGEAAYDHFVHPERIVIAKGMRINAPSFEAKSRASRLNATLANGILGAALGLALGLAGGLAVGSARSGLVAGALGGVLGALAGAGASEAALPFYFRRLDQGAEDLGKDVLFPLLIHAAYWGPLGAVAGAAPAIGSGSGRSGVASAAVGGLVGAILGAVAFEMIGAVAFPSDRTTDPLATHWAPRLLAKLSVALLASILDGFALLSPGKAARDPVRAA